MLFDVIASVALGVPGSYSFYGIPVTFIDKSNTSPISKLALGVLGGNYINTFVHELGHSLAYKYTCGRFGKIFINSDVSGSCRIKRWQVFWLTDFENSVVSLAGPLLEISFGLLTSLIVHKIHTRTSKHRGSLCYRLGITALKIQNIFTVFYPMYEPIKLLFKLQENSKDISSDLMQIYHYSGSLGASLSSALILSIGFLAFKIIYTIPVVREEPPSLSEKIYKTIKNVTHWMPFMGVV